MSTVDITLKEGYSIGIRTEIGQARKEVRGMKLLRFGIAALLVTSFVAAPVIARAEGGMMEHGMMSGKMMEHHSMMKEMMGTMKDMMGIMREMTHTPTAEQKKKLDEMMKNMDDMMKRHDEMMKQEGMKGM